MEFGTPNFDHFRLRSASLYCVATTQRPKKKKNVYIENKTFILEFYEFRANCIKLLIFQKLNWFGTRFLSFSRLLRSFFLFRPIWALCTLNFDCHKKGNVQMNLKLRFLSNENMNEKIKLVCTAKNQPNKNIYEIGN